MITITPFVLIDILSAAIQFYERIGLTEKENEAIRILKEVRKVHWDAHAELQINEVPF